MEANIRYTETLYEINFGEHIINMNKIKTIFYLSIVNFFLIFFNPFQFIISMLMESQRVEDVSESVWRLPFIIISFLPYITFPVLGIVLIIFTKKEKITGKLKTYLLLTGYSPVGFLVGMILHNLVYALFISLFGESIWNGGDEPVFFLLTVVVVPIVYIIGVIGSWIELRKR